MTGNTETSPHNTPSSREEPTSTDALTTRRAALAAGGASLATILSGCLNTGSGDGSSSETEDPTGELKISDQTRSGNHVKIDHVKTNVFSRVVIRDSDGNERQDGLHNIRPGGPVNGNGFDLELNPLFTENQEVTVELITRDDNAVIAEDTAEIQYKEHIVRYVEPPTAGDTAVTVYKSTSEDYEMQNGDEISNKVYSATLDTIADEYNGSDKYDIRGNAAMDDAYWYTPGFYGVTTLNLDQEHEDVPLESGTTVRVEAVDGDVLDAAVATVQ